MIVFGTDGWRGLIARDFTFENIQYVALATARYLNSLERKREKAEVVIGYDTRFLSKEFAQEVALVLANEGVVVHLANSIASTPQVSWHTKEMNADLGIVITASHNPPAYNGYKLKAGFGGPATPAQVSNVEVFLKDILNEKPNIEFKSINTYLDGKDIKFFDPKEPYLEYIKTRLNLDTINKAGFKILFDPMYGSGINTIKVLLPDADEIHGEYNPSFGELGHPEPIDENLHVLMERVKENNYDIGLALDGDADRLGAVDHEGNFVDSHKIFMILMKYLFEKKKMKGSVAKTVSLTSMVNKFCQKNNIELFETKVGFKYIAQLMSEKDIMIGGEESGGLGTSLHIPERDGIFNSLLLLEVMATENKSLKQLCDDLDDEFGTHRFMRRDVRVTPHQKITILNALDNKPEFIGSYKVIEINDKDGYKFFFDDGWLLIRASGTEPLLRFYSEASDINIVKELIEAALKIQ